MYKYISRVSVLCVFMLVFNSCEKGFLDETPTTDVSANSVAESTDNLFLVINGIHRLFYLRDGSNGRSGQTSMIMYSESLGDDFVHNARANGWWIGVAGYDDTRDPFDSDAGHPWSVLYEAILNANIVIAGAPTATGSESDRKGALGEALVFRAYCHFRLVQYYAERYIPGGSNTQLGVPLRLEPTQNELARATVEEVYTSINNDLDAAIPLLEGYSRFNKTHFDRNVAQGIKARVALVQGNYDVAASMARAARDGFSLMNNSDYQQGFNDYNNEEWMWGIHYNEEQESAFTNFGAWISRNFSSSNIRGNPKSINSTFYDIWPSTDVRTTVFDPTGNHDNLPDGVALLPTHSLYPYTSQKFLSVDNGDSRGDVPLMRAAEMYLIEAEALARQNKEVEAADVLFLLAANRDASYTLSTQTGDDLINEILRHRRFELWGEGFRFEDLKRLNLALDRTGSNHVSSLLNGVLEIPAGDPRWQWKIPQDEIDANSLMVQNP